MPVDIEATVAALRALPPSPTRDAFLGFVTSRGPTAAQRTGGPDHLTGSCFVLGPSLDAVLLTHHRKGRFWVQFGGHVEEGDRSLADTARREAREESGLPDLDLLTPTITDLDHHALAGGFTCSAHWDVGFVAIASPDDAVSVSDESEDVRWFPVDALPAVVPAGFADRLAVARAHAAAHLPPHTQGRPSAR